MARAALVAAALLASLSMGVSGASAFPVVIPVPSFPSQVFTGQSAPATLEIVNASTPPESTTFPVLNVTAISLNPSCGNVTSPCSAPDLGVIQLPGTGVGASGPASCLGTWTIAGPDPTGSWTFTPPGGEGSLVLGTGETCAIEFTFNALKVPTIDADPAAGVQTNQVATATPSAPGLALAFAQSGSDRMTVDEGGPVIDTDAAGESLGEQLAVIRGLAQQHL